MAALDRGWIPRGSFVDNPHITNACAHEDVGDFLCVVKKGQLDKSVRDAVAYVLNFQNRTNDPESQKILNMTGSELHNKANQVLGDYFTKYKSAGATCDFGGVAQLVEQDQKPSDDDTIFLTDDEYYGVIVKEGPSTIVLVICGAAVAIVGGLVGFVLAMRYNPRFNERVRKSSLFLPISSSKNSLIRSSLNLPMLDDYEEIQNAIDAERETFVPLKS